MRGERGFVLVLFAIFLGLVAFVFFRNLYPLGKKLMLDIHIRHAVDVSLLAGVHQETEALNSIAKINQALLILNAIAAPLLILSAVFPPAAEVLQIIQRMANLLKQIQDYFVKLFPYLALGAIIKEAASWRFIPIIFDKPELSVKRTLSVPGMPGILVFDEDHEEENLELLLRGCHLFGGGHEIKFDIVCWKRKGVPKGTSLLNADWQSNMEIEQEEEEE
ncbi:MAG TPA: hypothetical protein VJL87_01670 [Bdellovibrionota bacterium]|nr:hypothetical protein [Bdellovibrionota bacterium]